MKTNEFRCAICGNVYEKGLTEEEALEQLKKEFGEEAKPEDCDIVCDYCYNKMKGILKWN